MTAFTHALLLDGLIITSLASMAMASGDVFLGSRGVGVSAAGRRDGSDLLQELEKVAGRDHRAATENRVGRLEEALRPMFVAMPKDAAGLLDSVAVRYVLHRLFVQRHGWFVIGLDNGGDAWNSSSPAAVFKDHAEEHHNLFDDRFSNHGFSLHQVAVFAATLETLVHGESVVRLQSAYRVLGLSRSETLSDQEAAEVVQAYMLMYIQETDLATVTPQLFRQKLRLASKFYPTWPDTVTFAHGVRQRMLEDTDEIERNTWDSNLKIVEEIGERYGRWQDKECHVLKGTLLEMEQLGTGRVRLEDFYGPALHNQSWMFKESMPYLRQLGALDESNPQQTTVIIPNYLNSPTNCVASSKFYSVCCIDQCEELLGTLENRIAAPDATPARIAELIAALPSDTVQARGSLPSLLVQRLEDIAAHHGGLVPLHGRLFAQWMHHAYPRECPYPYMSGMTNPLTHTEWLASSNEPIEADNTEIRRILEESKLSDHAPGVLAEQELPWSHEEELFVFRPKLPEESTSAITRAFVFLLASFSAVALLLLRLYTPGKQLPGKQWPGCSSNHKYYV